MERMIFMEKCIYRNENGECCKRERRLPCEPMNRDDFRRDCVTIELHEVCSHSSIWGNSYYIITKEQLEDLKAGKVLYSDDGEYCQFFVLEE
jgi:hypothetical protein